MNTYTVESKNASSRTEASSHGKAVKNIFPRADKITFVGSHSPGVFMYEVKIGAAYLRVSVYIKANENESIDEQLNREYSEDWAKNLE